MATIKIKHSIGPSKKLLRLLRELFEACEENQMPEFEGGDMTLGFDSIGITMQGENAMATYTIPDDQVDFEISISPITGAKDKEGHEVIPVQQIKSSNENAISLTFPNGNGDLSRILAHVEGPGVASVDYVASYKKGRLLVPLKQQDATFIVTPGDVDTSTINGGDLTIASLEPDPLEEV